MCTHSVAESKTRDLVIVFILLQGHSGTRHLLASTTRRVKKTGEFSLDLSEMRPVNVVNLLLCHLK